MKEDRTRISSETYQVLQKNFPSLVLPSVPRRSAVPESQADLTDLLGFELPGDDSNYDVLPEVTKAFIKIVEEVVRPGKEVKPAYIDALIGNIRPYGDGEGEAGKPAMILLETIRLTWASRAACCPPT